MLPSCVKADRMRTRFCTRRKRLAVHSLDFRWSAGRFNSMVNESPNLQRILIVEDEDNARKGYEALLRKWNWEILGVASGEEALAKFQEFRPNLILADVELPGMNGLDLLNQLGDEISRMPVIIITGRGSDERVVQAIEAGAYWYIEKPLKPPVLRALLERALGQVRDQQVVAS